QAQSYDGLVTVVGCDKNMPGALMAQLRLNRPSILGFGGTIAPGCHNNKKLDIISAFEAYGQQVAGTIGETEFSDVIRQACPGAGACGGMFTAHTMLSAIPAMGMSMPFNSSIPAVDADKGSDCQVAVAALRNLLEL